MLRLQHAPDHRLLGVLEVSEDEEAGVCDHDRHASGRAAYCRETKRLSLFLTCSNCGLDIDSYGEIDYIPDFNPYPGPGA